MNIGKNNKLIHSPTIYFAISSHGYGHIGMTAPVIRALYQNNPNIRIVIKCLAEKQFLMDKFGVEFIHIKQSPDVGMIMTNALSVDVEKTYREYQCFHRSWSENLENERQLLRKIKPDLIFSNIPYQILMAAKELDIPCLTMCSLNWLDLFQYYFSDIEGSVDIYQQIQASYQCASTFIQPAPSMKMNIPIPVTQVSSLANIGGNKKHLIKNKIGINDKKLVLVSMGGVSYDLGYNHWRHDPNIHWIINYTGRIDRDDMTKVLDIESLMSYKDLLKSCDALVTKPGYGHFSDAACNDVPILYVARDDWPEEYYLVKWLKQNARCLEVQSDKLETGNITGELEILWAQKKKIIPPANGANEVVALINDFFQ
ncbi:MAG: hypothetical protein HON94_13790 [Methylococcales bacterium]|jgi:hypothetical protein|nr:hypothetical protein [Methylococcales bacterium]MBT7409280.1 hypothetical protein [Methylococcales bacterium]